MLNHIYDTLNMVLNKKIKNYIAPLIFTSIFGRHKTI